MYVAFFQSMCRMPYTGVKLHKIIIFGQNMPHVIKQIDWDILNMLWKLNLDKDVLNQTSSYIIYVSILRMAMLEASIVEWQLKRYVKASGSLY